ncbi:MAG: ROK family protein [Brevinema sp.]
MQKPPRKRYQNKIQEQTERTILKECALRGRFTGVDLGKALKISLPTINTYLEKFQKNGYIKEIGTIGSDLGRKSRLWDCILLQKIIMGVEIDRHHVQIGLFQLNGQAIGLKKYPCSLDSSSFCHKLEEIILNFLSETPQNQQLDIKCLGISIPGDVSFDRKHIIFATNLGLENISIAPLEESLNIPIFLENEANAGALGEFFLDDNPHNDNMIFLSVSQQGVGGGLIFSGKLLKGMHRKGGEIGHMSIDLNGKPCSCGNRGCLERYTSEEALQESVNLSLDKIFTSGEAHIETLISNYAHHLGLGIRNLLSIFDASKICVGGNISVYWKNIYPYIHQEVFKNNRFYKSDIDIILTSAKYQQFAALYGVAIIPFLPLFYETERY